MIYDLGMTTEILQTMGRRVRVLREERGWNRIELAAEVRRRGVKCSNSMISSIEIGRANPSLDVFVAIADALDVTLDYLATRTDRIESPNALEPEPEPDYFSPTTDELARLADALPEWRQTELLSIAQGMAEGNQALIASVASLTGEIKSQLAGTEAFLDDATLAAITSAVVRLLAGNAPSADAAAIRQSFGLDDRDRPIRGSGAMGGSLRLNEPARRRNPAG